MTRAHWHWPALILMLTAASAVLVLGGVDSTFRPVVTLAFLAICPGMALLPLVRIDEPLSELVLAIGLSVALDTIVAASTLYAGAWSPDGALVILVVISAAGSVLQLVRPWPR
jgi:uncharacterized membrane protein